MLRAVHPRPDGGARARLRPPAPGERLAGEPVVARDVPGLQDAVGHGRPGRARVGEVVAPHHVVGVADRGYVERAARADRSETVPGADVIDALDEELPRRRGRGCGERRLSGRNGHQGGCEDDESCEHALSVGARRRPRHRRGGHSGSPPEGGGPPRNGVWSPLRPRLRLGAGHRRRVGVRVGELRRPGRGLGPEAGVDSPRVPAERGERLRAVAVVPVEDAAGGILGLGAPGLEVRVHRRVVDVVEDEPAAVPRAVVGLVLRRERDPPRRITRRRDGVRADHPAHDGVLDDPGRADRRRARRVGARLRRRRGCGDHRGQERDQGEPAHSRRSFGHRGTGSLVT